jgi:hypothetical protein
MKDEISVTRKSGTLRFNSLPFFTANTFTMNLPRISTLAFGGSQTQDLAHK